MESAQHRKFYSEEFKRNAADYHVEHHGTLAETAKHFGVTSGMMHKWLKNHARNPASPPLQSSAGASEIPLLRNEIMAMKKEIGELKKIVGKAFLTRFTEEMEEATNE
jgi:transposase-like protein